MEKYKIDVKDRRGRFSYLHPDRSKYITGRALGNDFDKESIEKIIHDRTRTEDYSIQENQSNVTHPAHEAPKPVDPADYAAADKPYDPSYDYHTDPVAILYVRSRLRLVVDLQTNIKAQQNAVYARKVKLSNLKEMAKTVVYVQEHRYDTWEELLQHHKDLSAKLASAEISLKELTGNLRKTNEMIHYAGQYYAAKAVRSEFLKSGNKKYT